MYLSAEVFKTVISSTPLISLDIIIENHQGEVLLGLRNNRPAFRSWFVPGGRIYKNETLSEAFIRILKSELSLDATLDDASFVGVYEHFYEDSIYSGDQTTHYIVLAYRFLLSDIGTYLGDDQHSSFDWFSVFDLLNEPTVHENTKAYFSS